MTKRVLVCLLSAFPVFGGCASPQHYDPTDAPGPAVAVAPNDVRPESPPLPSSDTALAPVDAQVEAYQPTTDASIDGRKSSGGRRQSGDGQVCRRDGDRSNSRSSARLAPQPPPVVVAHSRRNPAPARLPPGTKVSFALPAQMA